MYMQYHIEPDKKKKRNLTGIPLCAEVQIQIQVLDHVTEFMIVRIISKLTNRHIHSVMHHQMTSTFT